MDDEVFVAVPVDDDPAEDAVLLSDEPPPELDDDELPESPDDVLDDPLEDDPAVTDDPERASVRSNPPPLNTMPTALKTLRRRPSHSGHTVSESSLNDCTASKRWSHSVHA